MIVTPAMTGVSIDGCAVLKPGSLPPAAAAIPEIEITRARAAKATIERLFIAPPKSLVCVV